jgi:hypothetical protein
MILQYIFIFENYTIGKSIIKSFYDIVRHTSTSNFFVRLELYYAMLPDHDGILASTVQAAAAGQCLVSNKCTQLTTFYQTTK